MKKLLYVALLATGVIVLMAPPAMAQEEKPFTLHGEARFGYEYHANTQDFDKNDNSDQFNYWPYRVRIAAEGKFTKGVTAWIEFQNGGTFGSLAIPARDGSDAFFGPTGNTAELYQGNITLDKIWWKNFSARIGRQEIVEGTELMLGSRLLPGTDLRRHDRNLQAEEGQRDGVLYQDQREQGGSVQWKCIPPA